MPTFHKTVNINAPREKVWEILSDLDAVAKYSPAVKSAHSTSSGENAERRCEISPRGSINETFSEWKEGEGYLVSVVGGSLPPAIKDLKTVFNLSEVDENTTTLSVEINYDITMGIIGTIINALIIKRLIGRGLPGLVMGLKHHVETGEEVTRDTVLSG